MAWKNEAPIAELENPDSDLRCNKSGTLLILHIMDSPMVEEGPDRSYGHTLS